MIEALKSLGRNPLVIGIALGLVVATFEWRLPVSLARTISLLLAQKHHHERFSAAALLAATVLSFFTISAGLWWLRQHPAWLPP